MWNQNMESHSISTEQAEVQPLHVPDQVILDAKFSLSPRNQCYVLTIKAHFL